MPAIGYVQRLENGSFKGVLKTLAVRAEIEIIPNRGKVGDQPDYRILTGGSELGGGWIRTGEVSGREYTARPCGCSRRWWRISSPMPRC